MKEASGVSLPVLLTIIFVVLKLTNVIAWSWLWVLSPLWIGFGIFVAFIILMILIAITAVAIAANKE